MISWESGRDGARHQAYDGVVCVCVCTLGVVGFLSFFSLLGMLGNVVLWCTLGMISLLFSSILLLGLFCSVIAGRGRWCWHGFGGIRVACILF